MSKVLKSRLDLTEAASFCAAKLPDYRWQRGYIGLLDAHGAAQVVQSASRSHGATPAVLHGSWTGAAIVPTERDVEH